MASIRQTNKNRYITEFQGLRRFTPVYSNWLLFVATIESFLKQVGAQADFYRITLSLLKVNEWYIGDGWYSDGSKFAFDYYNSFVLHPMFVECQEVLTNGGKRGAWNIDPKNFGKGLKRMQRYGVILERLISPEGTFPVFGRSITYRTGVLQPLAFLAWREWLPEELSEGQVRSAMTAVLKRMFRDDRNFNQKGFLTIGFNGKQPEIADVYTNNGSLYMATLAFLPLGLPADHSFGQPRQHPGPPKSMGWRKLPQRPCLLRITKTYIHEKNISNAKKLFGNSFMPIYTVPMPDTIHIYNSHTIWM